MLFGNSFIGWICLFSKPYADTFYSPQTFPSVNTNIFLCRWPQSHLHQLNSTLDFCPISAWFCGSSFTSCLVDPHIIIWYSCTYHKLVQSPAKLFLCHWPHCYLHQLAYHKQAPDFSAAFSVHMLRILSTLTCQMLQNLITWKLLCFCFYWN